MANPWASRVILVAALIGLAGLAPRSGRADALVPIIYDLKVPAPDTHIVEVEAIFPAGKGPSIEIMMATWTPGFFGSSGPVWFALRATQGNRKKSRAQETGARK